MTEAVQIAGGGVGLVIVLPSDRMPYVAHWGRMLAEQSLAGLVETSLPGVMRSAFDRPRSVGVLPLPVDGWAGVPGLQLHLEGAGQALAPRLRSWEQDASRILLRFDGDGWGVELEYRFDEHGVLTASAEVVNAGEAVLDLAALRLLLPIPERAAQVLDLTGRWSGERAPQRWDLVDGRFVRAARRGRPGHDSPTLTVAGTPGFGFRDGETWSVHLAWSGNGEIVVDRLAERAGVNSALIGAGELLEPGEVRLAPGERYVSAPVIFAWSAEGLDGLSARLHRHVRDFAAHPSRPRPIVLNTWEAVYFDHDVDRLTELAEVAASVGVERFVLDDGWFRGRRDDMRALGDWFVDEDVWGDRLATFARTIHERGMEFGLWVEPEMINPVSELFRRHPEWVLAPAGEPATWRHQLVLNLANPDAWQWVFERLDALVADLGVDYLKWDHNRELTDPVGRADGAVRVREHTLAVYRMLDALHERHPGLEIESCASGGARVDLGILRRTQRIWASDTNDPIERQHIQRWTGLLVPPELVGTHVGPPRAHTTGRTTDLSFRLATALFGHAGIEWNLLETTAQERDAIARWAALFARLRPLLHDGVTVRADLDDARLLHGVVSGDAAHAVFAWVTVASPRAAATPRVVLPGLDPGRRYTVRVLDDLGEAGRHSSMDPPWMADGPLSATGELLTESGIPLPLLNPGQAVLLEAIADA